MFIKLGSLDGQGAVYGLTHADSQNSDAPRQTRLRASSGIMLHEASRPSPLLDIRWLPS